MAIHFQNDLILLNIHKNATTWMRAVCRERFGDIVAETNILNLSKLEVDKVFAFVRNPFDRILSGYLYNKKNWHKKDNQKAIAQIDEYGPYPTFEEYLTDALESGIGDSKWQVFKRQVDYLDSDINKMFFLGRFENIEDDMDKLCDKANVTRIDLDMTRKYYSQSGNKSRHLRGKDRDPLSYREYYNDVTKELVEKLYGEDIRVFNYSF